MSPIALTTLAPWSPSPGPVVARCQTEPAEDRRNKPTCNPARPGLETGRSNFLIALAGDYLIAETDDDVRAEAPSHLGRATTFFVLRGGDARSGGGRRLDVMVSRRRRRRPAAPVSGRSSSRIVSLGELKKAGGRLVSAADQRLNNGDAPESFLPGRERNSHRDGTFYGRCDARRGADCCSCPHPHADAGRSPDRPTRPLLLSGDAAGFSIPPAGRSNPQVFGHRFIRRG
jgi:hypothetical protein